MKLGVVVVHDICGFVNLLLFRSLAVAYLSWLFDVWLSPSYAQGLLLRQRKHMRAYKIAGGDGLKLPSVKVCGNP